MSRVKPDLDCVAEWGVSRDFFCVVIFFWCGFFALVSCGGKKTAESVPVPSDRAEKVLVRKEQQKNTPKIRLLLKENFSSAKIVNSDLATVVIVRISNGKIYLYDSEDQVVGSGSGFRLKPQNNKLLRMDGVSYRGVFEVFINPVKRPVIVNDVNIETYLRGVVPSELSPITFPYIQAIKTQAVAARTFALANLGLNARKGFDLYSDSRSQVYRGKKGEHSLSDRAVQETKGIVAVYKKEPIVAFYSSTCGGLTASYHYIFQKSEIFYLQGGVKCPDQDSPYRKWKSRILISDVQEKFDRLGIGKLKKIISVRKSQNKRTVEMKFVGSKGNKILKGLKIRSMLQLRSNWITDLDTRKNKKYISEIHVKGRGWGHGVGLCQMGTVKLAQKDWSFERILKYYYSGIKIEQRW